ncbi:MAG: hypothetical protein KF681_15860 [Bdellovibrionaceae bacterium]|nr:hypothetical protein [Pseudobdellovibrionaceae bacterium]
MDEIEKAFLELPIRDSVSALSASAQAILWQLIAMDPNKMKTFTSLHDLSSRVGGFQEEVMKGFLELWIKRYILRYQDEDGEFFCKLRPEALVVAADYLKNLKPVLDLNSPVSS